MIDPIKLKQRITTVQNEGPFDRKKWAQESEYKNNLDIYIFNGEIQIK